MIPIPEGVESYEEESTRSSGYSDSQETLDQPGMLTGSGATPSDDEMGGTTRRPTEGLCSLAGPDMKAVLHGM